MNAREIALNIMSDVLEHESYLNLELKNSLHSDLSLEDRRFTTALVSATLENIYRIDYIIDQFARGRLHLVIRNILRLGVCQIFYMDSVPESAAVNESVKLVEAKGKPQLKGYVNGTLRNIVRSRDKIEFPQPEDDFVQYLHITYSYPKWICRMFVQAFDNEEAEQLLAYKGDRRLTAIRQNKWKQEQPFDQFKQGRYLDDAFYIKNAQDIENMILFREGRFAVQGEAAMISVRAANIQPSHRVLDVCAAPGGKSLYASQFARQGHITALDVYEHRVQLMKENRRRLGVPNMQTGVQDGTKLEPKYEQAFDVVLVDVPCTALGLLYRKPDIKIFKKRKDIASLLKVQRAILDKSARYVKPGGTLLYSTCTISAAENEQMVRSFLKGHQNFQIDGSLKDYIPEGMRENVQDGCIQLLPHRDQIDGFFIAKMQKEV